MNLKNLKFELQSDLKKILPDNISYQVYLNAESSSFIRFNRGEIRQPGSVVQAHATIDINQEARHSKSQISLSSSREENFLRLKQCLEPQLDYLSDLDPDPHFIVNPECQKVEAVSETVSDTPQDVLQDILDASKGLDLVGIYATGRIARGYFNSGGSNLHHESDRSHFDFSIYAHHDKAVKCSVSGDRWNKSQFATKIKSAKEQLPYLYNESKRIEPGDYRCYLAPSAVGSILSLLSWSSFSEKAHQTGLSPLKLLRTKEKSLHSGFSLSESPSSLQGPRFNETGFLSPEEVSLIKDGTYASSLVSPRSGKEFGIQHNGAGPSESPGYLKMAYGSLCEEEVLEKLGTGVLISDLWYLNFSDPQVCRMTGMTRFASFWVEDGKLVAPLSVMRFDDSVFNIFGSKLEGVTQQTQTFHEAHTYGSRNTGVMEVPGALVNGLTFTL